MAVISKPARKGRLVVFEGADGTGKTTQAKLLHKHFQKRKIPSAYISFPDYTSSWGKLIRRYLDGEFGDVNQVDPYLASVLYAGDRLVASEKVRRWLVMGKIVVCNRYVASNIAHQSVKLQTPMSRRQFIKWVEDFEYQQNRIPKEDVAILLSIPASISQKLMRSKKKDIHERDKNYLSEVVKVFEGLAKNRNYWKKIECVENRKLLTKEKIHNKVLGILSL